MGYSYDNEDNRKLRVDSDGYIYDEPFNQVGYIDFNNGYVYDKNSNRRGRVDLKNGYLYDEGLNKVGKIASDGYICAEDIEGAGCVAGNINEWFYQKENKDVDERSVYRGGNRTFPKVGFRGVFGVVVIIILAVFGIIVYFRNIGKEEEIQDAQISTIEKEKQDEGILEMADNEETQGDSESQMETENEVIDAKDTGILCYVSNDYSEGIALRAEPDQDAELLIRMPYMSTFLAIDYEADWAYVEYKEHAGWTHMDYSTELGNISYDDYYAGEYHLEDYGDLYYVSNDYSDGTSLFAEPSQNAEELYRLPYLTEFLVTDYEGEWGYTCFDGYEGWINIGDYAEIIASPRTLEDCYYTDEWYYITTDYEPGIALHPIPEKDSETLTRIPYGTEFYVEYISGNYGYTNYKGYQGWINVGDHAAPVSMAIQAMAEIPINAEYFIDINFRNYVQKNFDSNGNGSLSAEERMAVTHINMDCSVDSYGALKSLKGVEYFPNLLSLMCDYNQVSELDVSHNLKLQTLTFNHNEIRSIDLSNNTELIELYATDNYLTELNVSNNMKLQAIYCDDNFVEFIDISNNPNLNEDWTDFGGARVKTVGESNSETIINGINISDYILPESGVRYLSYDEIVGMTAQELCYARNEIYARYGRKFLSSELTEYFNTKSWYYGDYEAENFPNDILNDFEQKNVQLLLEREYELCPGGYVLY